LAHTKLHTDPETETKDQEGRDHADYRLQSGQRGAAQTGMARQDVLIVKAAVCEGGYVGCWMVARRKKQQKQHRKNTEEGDRGWARHCFRRIGNLVHLYILVSPLLSVSHFYLLLGGHLSNWKL